MKGLGISLKIIEGTKNYISVEFTFFEEVAYLRCDVLVSQSCLTLATLWTVAFQPPVYGILQARILEWVAIPSSRGSSWPREQTWVSCIAGRHFTSWTTREARSHFHFKLLWAAADVTRTRGWWWGCSAVMIPPLCPEHPNLVCGHSPPPTGARASAVLSSRPRFPGSRFWWSERDEGPRCSERGRGMEQAQMLEQWAYFTHPAVLSHPNLDWPQEKTEGRDHGGQKRRQRGWRLLAPRRTICCPAGHPGCPLLWQQGWTWEKPLPGTPPGFSRVFVWLG